MTEKRVFTEEELKELGKDTLEALNEAIERGDKERAKKLARRMRLEFQQMHDLYRDWTTSLYTWIGKRHGDKGIAEAYEECLGSWFNPITDLYPKDDFRSKVTMTSLGLRGHLVGLQLEEDDEKVTVMQNICGSGGRLIKAGHYGPPRNYLIMEKAQPQTFDRENLPVYCAHCWWHNALPLLRGVPPAWLVFPAQKLAEEPCRFCVYKDPKYIPEEVYESVERGTGKRIERFR